MKKYLLVFLISIFSLTTTVNANSNENFIVTKVGKKIITNLDVKNKLLSTLIIAGEDINQKNIDGLKKETLKSLISLRLKEIELSEFNYKIPQQQINSFLAQISKNNIQELQNNFINYNVDFEVFLTNVKTEIKWRQFIYKNYADKIEIDDEAVDNEVNKILNSQSIKNKELNLSEIVISQNDNNNNDEIIAKIFDEIKTNGFEKTAVKFSITNSSKESGNLGWINEKALSEEIFNILKNMDINQISKPIFQANSILFLKINGKRELNKDLDKLKLKKNIIQQKQNEMFNLYSQSHLSKLKNKHLIEYK